jgi:hypothetical protein
MPEQRVRGPTRGCPQELFKVAGVRLDEVRGFSYRHPIFPANFSSKTCSKAADHVSQPVMGDVQQVRPGDVACPRCGAEPGQQCISENRKKLKQFHLERIQQAKDRSASQEH